MLKCNETDYFPNSLFDGSKIDSKFNYTFGNFYMYSVNRIYFYYFNFTNMNKTVNTCKVNF